MMNEYESRLFNYLAQQVNPTLQAPTPEQINQWRREMEEGLAPQRAYPPLNIRFPVVPRQAIELARNIESVRRNYSSSETEEALQSPFGIHIDVEYQDDQEAMLAQLREKVRNTMAQLESDWARRGCLINISVGTMLRDTQVRSGVHRVTEHRNLIFDDDRTCAFNARSPHIRCAVNPSGPCEGCIHYESVSQD